MARKSRVLVVAVSLGVLSAALGVFLVWLATEGLMTDRLRHALREARSGRAFMASEALRGTPLAATRTVTKERIPGVSIKERAHQPCLEP